MDGAILEKDPEFWMRAFQIPSEICPVGRLSLFYGLSNSEVSNVDPRLNITVGNIDIAGAVCEENAQVTYDTPLRNRKGSRRLHVLVNEDNRSSEGPDSGQQYGRPNLRRRNTSGTIPAAGAEERLQERRECGLPVPSKVEIPEKRIEERAIHLSHVAGVIPGPRIPSNDGMSWGRVRSRSRTSI